MPERLCGHAPCGCLPEPGFAYCGPRCAESDRAGAVQPDTVCRCGHPNCRLKKEPSPGEKVEGGA